MDVRLIELEPKQTGVGCSKAILTRSAMLEMYFLTMAVIKAVHQIASAASLRSELAIRQ